MKKCSYGRDRTKLLAAALLLFSTVADGLRSVPVVAVSSNGQSHLGVDNDHMMSKDGSNDDLLAEIHATGSILPDCSHACGPCFPCKRVMVTFKCSIAESCPIAYRCMCRGRYYHVPSN